MNKITKSKIQYCRICNSEQLEDVLKLDKMPFTDEFITELKLEHISNYFGKYHEYSVRST